MPAALLNQYLNFSNLHGKRKPHDLEEKVWYKFLYHNKENE